MTLIKRIVKVQSWWSAWQIVRRHPEAGLIETHPGGGPYDSLTVVRQQPEPVVIATLNRVGTVHAGYDSDTSFTWGQEHRQDDRQPGVEPRRVDRQYPADPDADPHRRIYRKDRTRPRRHTEIGPLQSTRQRQESSSATPCAAKQSVTGASW